MTSAHDFQEVYDDLGIDLSDLGCVMLGTETPDTSFIDDRELYYARDEKRFWIDGRVKDSHVTLKYGLLKTVKREHVDKVLEGLALPKMLMGDELVKFDSPYADEPYECIVMKIGKDTRNNYSRQMLSLNERLNFLPHVNTFPDYNPHVTLAYVRKGWYARNSDKLWGRGVTVKTTELDYGEMQ